MSQYLEMIEKIIDMHINSYQRPKLAKVSDFNPSKYTCDCIILESDGTEAVDKNIVYDVPVPKIWGTNQAGIWTSISKDSIVLLNFIEGYIERPIITAVMGTEVNQTVPDNTLLIKNNSASINVGSKIRIEANEQNLGNLINELITEIKNITISASSPLMGTCPVSGGSVPVNVLPNQLSVSQKNQVQLENLANNIKQVLDNQ
ncbi:MAG: hypothetical protein ACRCTQ_04845 [Brevinemataceae bacterium]